MSRLSVTRNRMARSWLRWLARVALVANLLVAPVSYTAGALTSHPHMFLQFWFESHDGSLDHHADAAERDTGSAEVHQRQQHPLTLLRSTDAGVEATNDQMFAARSGSTSSRPSPVAATGGISDDLHVVRREHPVTPHSRMTPDGWQPSLSDPPPRLARPMT